jgi:hypothetical protein
MVRASTYSGILRRCWNPDTKLHHGATEDTRAQARTYGYSAVAGIPIRAPPRSERGYAQAHTQGSSAITGIPTQAHAGATECTHKHAPRDPQFCPINSYSHQSIPPTFNVFCPLSNSSVCPTYCSESFPQTVSLFPRQSVKTVPRKSSAVAGIPIQAPAGATEGTRNYAPRDPALLMAPPQGRQRIRARTQAHTQCSSAVAGLPT